MNFLIVVLHHRTPRLTLDCLRSLAAQIDTVPDARVMVVDNGSGDGSDKLLEQAMHDEGWDRWAMLRVSPRNLGFAAGNNWAIRQAGVSRYILLLNSDTVMHEGTLEHCYGLMESDRWIGAMSCALQTPDGSVQNVSRRFPNPLRQTITTAGLPWYWPRAFAWADTEDLGWDRGATRRDVDWIGGAFFLVRGNLYRRLGGLDEHFFFWGEDLEFCRRIWRAGYRCHYDPRATITHLGGQSSDATRLDECQYSPHYWRSRYLVQRKCYGRAAEWWLRTFDLTNLALRSAVLTLVRRRDPRTRSRYLTSMKLIARTH